MISIKEISPLGKSSISRLAPFGFIAPFFFMMIIFQYIPLFVMAKNSFFRYSLLKPEEKTFIGLQNYILLLSDHATLQSIAVTIIFSVSVVVIIIPVSLLISVFLNSDFPGCRVVRAVVFLPVVTSSVAVSTIWLFMLDPGNGLINGFLEMFHIPPSDFLTSRFMALPALVIMTVWQQTGFCMVIFMAGLQSIPKELYDAAKLEGASRLQELWFITVPLLGRTMLFVVVMTTVFSLQSFAPAYIMTGGSPQGTTNFIIFYIYRLAFSLQQPGYACALSVILLALTLTIGVVQNRVMRVQWKY